jgi:transcriptional regulator with XRE-family HTH domain
MSSSIIKSIREKRKLMQKEVAAIAGLHPANYNKMEKGEREPSIRVVTSLKSVKHYFCSKEFT